MKKNIKYALFGALIGDYYGSYWEFLSNKPKDLKDGLKLREGLHQYTDDTLMTLAIAKCFLDDNGKPLKEKAISNMREIGNEYRASYGASFSGWLSSPNPTPYFSWGNGAAMRVSAVGLASDGCAHAACDDARAVTEVTHNHPYGIFYAQLVAYLISRATEIGDMNKLVDDFALSFPVEYERVASMDLEELHKDYWFNESSHDTVPQALYCFFTSKSFEDCLARSLYIGGDSDTLAAIACSIAAPFYGDAQVKPFVDRLPKLDGELSEIIKVFSLRYLC